MISPALTCWPPNRLTPSRWELESRPFRLDDAPFLCAISALLSRLCLARRGLGPGGGWLGLARARRLARGRGLARVGLFTRVGRLARGRRLARARGLARGPSTALGDAGDLHLGVALTVAQPAPVAGLVLVADHVDLGATDVAHDLGGDMVAAEFLWVGHHVVAVDDEHGGKREGGAHLTGKAV